METKKSLWSVDKCNKKCTLLFKTVRGLKRSKPQNLFIEDTTSDYIDKQAIITRENEKINISGDNENE